MLMEDSTTYQFVLEKGLKQGLSQGRSEGQKNLLLRQGTRRFGAPTPETIAALGAIADVAQLERLAERMLDAKDWDDLLAGAS